jgi:hypothetical protein
MNTTTDLLDQVLALPEAERAQITRRLLASLSFDPLIDDDWGSAWQAEIERRLDRLDRGDSSPRDWRVALDDIDTRLQKGRTP